MEQVTRYKCDHCKKLLQQKSAMKKHESVCFFNPDTKSCITCAHFSSSPNERGCLATDEPLEKLKTNCSMHKNWEASDYFNF